MKFIPNFVTLINVFSGSMAAVFVLRGDYASAFIALIICFVADYADGFLARILDARSEVGQELDSLADMISFGFVPGCMLFHLIARSKEYMAGDLPSWIAYIGFVFTAFAALRLARFNVDEDQTYYFKGIPTPAAAAAVFGVMIIEWLGIPSFQALTSSGIFLIVLTLLLAAMMNLNFRVFSFKMHSFGWKSNELKYLTLILSAVLFGIFREAALLPAIGVYVLLSLLTHFGILPFEDNYNPPIDEVSGEN